MSPEQQAPKDRLLESLPGEVQAFGNPLAVYRASTARYSLKIGLAAVLLAIGLMSLTMAGMLFYMDATLPRVLDRQGRRLGPPPLLPGILVLLPALPALGYSVWLIRRLVGNLRRRLVVLCPHGLADVRDTAVLPCRWEEVVAIHEDCTRFSRNDFYLGITERYTLRIIRREGQLIELTRAVAQVEELGQHLREEAARRGIPVFQNSAGAITPVCPVCGLAPFDTVAPRGGIAFVADRICKQCGIRYTLPTPVWAAGLFIALGMICLALLVCIRFFGGEARGALNFPYAILLAAGCGCLLQGMYTLARRQRR